MTIHQNRLAFLKLIDSVSQVSEQNFFSTIEKKTELSDKPVLTFYQEKLKDADSDLLLEIINTTAIMDEKTRKTFRTFIINGELELTRERLAGWLDKHHKLSLLK
jgi:hypothetical protein